MSSEAPSIWAGNQTNLSTYAPYSFTYDAENRIVAEANSIGGAPAQYSYD